MPACMMLDCYQTKKHNPFKDHSLVVVKGLHNSMKLSAMPCRVNKDRCVIVKNSDKTWSTGGENSNPLQYSCHENAMNSVKRQKDMTPEDESHRPKSETESVNLSVESASLQLMDCSPSSASVHGIFQARILEWVAIIFFRTFS